MTASIQRDVVWTLRNRGQTFRVPGRTATPDVHSPPPITRAAAAPRPTITPLAPERYKVQLTISRETHEKLRRVQVLLRHTIPNFDEQ